MYCNRRVRFAALLAAGFLVAAVAPAQDRRGTPRIDIEQYTIDAERIASGLRTFLALDTQARRT